MSILSQRWRNAAAFLLEPQQGLRRLEPRVIDASRCLVGPALADALFEDVVGQIEDDDPCHLGMENGEEGCEQCSLCGR